MRSLDVEICSLNERSSRTDWMMAIFFFTESTRRVFLPVASARGTPGNPPPEPRSPETVRSFIDLWQTYQRILYMKETRLFPISNASKIRKLCLLQGLNQDSTASSSSSDHLPSQLLSIGERVHNKGNGTCFARPISTLKVLEQFLQRNPTTWREGPSPSETVSTRSSSLKAMWIIRRS